MSIINKVADEALRQNMLLAQMSNASYNAINGTRQNERDFKEGILNVGKIDDQMEVTRDKITKEMIMDYKREQQEKSFKSTFSRLVPQKDSTGAIMLTPSGAPIMVEERYEIPTIFQQTGLDPKLKNYVPLYTGDEANEAKQQDIYNRFVENKKKIKEEYEKIKKLKEDKNKQLIETETLSTVTGTPALFMIPFINKLKEELRRIELERQNKLMEILRADREIENQENNLELVRQNILSNAKERTRIESENKQYIKEYGEKFNILNRDRISVDKQPNETDGEYFRRIQELEKTAFDPIIYSDKAAISENRKFKKNLQEILKDPAKIENIIKSFQRAEDVYIINNNWPKISIFLKNKYGVNNRFTTEKEYIDEIKAALKNIQSSTFNVSQITKNKPIPTNDTLILSNPANEKKYIKIWEGDVYYSDDPFNNFNKLVYKNFNTVFGNFNKELMGIHTTKKKLYKNVAEKINISSVDPLTLPGAAIVGTGIKKGRGMQQIKENEEITQKADEIPKIYNFGNKVLLLNKLYYKNILSIKDKKGHSIEKLPNIRVSDDFVKIIINIYNNNTTDFKNDFNKLDENEQDLLNLLFFISGLNKEKNIDIKRNDKVNKLKERLILVESQIKAGNNNPVVKKELNEIVNKLYLFGAISYNQAKDYLKQF
jgi:hypothetical protein